MTTLGVDELLTDVLIPRRNCRHYFKKVGARRALAISRVSFAGLFGSGTVIITVCSAALCAAGRRHGAAQPGKRIAVRREDDGGGKSEKAEFLAAYDALIQPIQGRVSAPYRKRSVRESAFRFFG
jgi:CO/xanthine dehydrogenase FAD-binding subunit